MALPIIAHFEGDKVNTQVRRNAEFNEYIVEFWKRCEVSGRYFHQSGADYFTSDKADALGTAETSAK